MLKFDLLKRYVITRMVNISPDFVRNTFYKMIIFLKEKSYKKNPYYFESSKYVYEISNNIFYYPIPKVASTSMKLLLISRDKNPSMRNIHQHPEVLEKRVDIKSIPKNAFVFTIMRSPYDRVISSYNSILNGGYRSQYFLNRFALFHKSLTFTKYVETIMRVPDHLIDVHLRSYHQLLKDVPLNYTARLEALDDDLESIYNLTGQRVLLNTVHLNSSDKKNVIELDQDTAKLIAERYHDDIKKYY